MFKCLLIDLKAALPEHRQKVLVVAEQNTHILEGRPATACGFPAPEVDTALGHTLDHKPGHYGDEDGDPQVLGFVPQACHDAPLGGETVAVPRNCEPAQLAYESALWIKARDLKELIEVEIHQPLAIGPQSRVLGVAYQREARGTDRFAILFSKECHRLGAPVRQDGLVKLVLPFVCRNVPVKSAVLDGAQAVNALTLIRMFDALARDHPLFSVG